MRLCGGMSRNTSRKAEPTSGQRRDWRGYVLIVVAAVQILLVWHPVVPLGVPGEWIWERIPIGPGEFAQLLANLVFVVPIAALYYWFCSTGDLQLARDRRRTGLWLGGLVIAGFGWLWTVQQAIPDELHSLGRGPIVMNFPAFSGYFTEARAIESLGSYLSDYESLMSEGDVLHIGTHPPALTVSHYLLLELFRSSSALTDLVLATRPGSVRATEEMIAYLPPLKGPPTSRADLAELWGASLLIQLAGCLCVIPLFHLTSQTLGSQAAWRTACLWPLVPAIGVFLPKSDVLLAFIGLATIALWRADGPARGRAIAAGAVFWIGMTVSLAMLPVGLLCAFLSLHDFAMAQKNARVPHLKRVAARTALAASAFVVLTVLVWLVFDLHLPRVWSWNFGNHAAFYDSYVRTYWIWLFVNALELSLAVGLPIVAALILWRREIPLLAVSTLPVLAVVLLLWLSGKNSGETARLWLFLMPWLLWLSCPLWRTPLGDVRWRRILTLQLLISYAVVVRVSGFSFFQIAGIVD